MGTHIPPVQNIDPTVHTVAHPNVPKPCHSLWPRSSCPPPDAPGPPLTGVPGQPICDADCQRFASSFEGSHITLSSGEGDSACATTAPTLLLHPKL